MSSPSTLLSASELPQALLMLLLALAVLALLDYAKDVGLLARRRSLSGRLVLVTGAAGGLGRALALELARRGALLALWDVRADALHACINWLVDECGVPAERVSASVVDVADAAAVRAAAQSQLDKLGPAHAVVSNAAVVNGERLLDASEDRLRASFAVNALSHVWIARALVPQLAASGGHGGGARQGGGVLVTIGSLMAELPAARLADYCASKAAVLLMHECLRWELRGGGGGHARTSGGGGAGSGADGGGNGGVHCLHVQSHMIDTPLFAGGVPGRFGWVRRLLPPLRAVTVARRVVDAIETRRTRVVVPYVLKWLPPLLQLLPAALRDLALDLAGAGCAMDGFVGGGARDACLPRAPASRRARSPAGTRKGGRTERTERR